MTCSEIGLGVKAHPRWAGLPFRPTPCSRELVRWTQRRCRAWAHGTWNRHRLDPYCCCPDRSRVRDRRGRRNRQSAYRERQRQHLPTHGNLLNGAYRACGVPKSTHSANRPSSLSHRTYHRRFVRCQACAMTSRTSMSLIVTTSGTIDGTFSLIALAASSDSKTTSPNPDSSFHRAGATGLELATSGVTGRNDDGDA